MRAMPRASPSWAAPTSRASAWSPASSGTTGSSPVAIQEGSATSSTPLSASSTTRPRELKAGLVVLATGLGKTWLSAFDSKDYDRVLFIAHREEILDQALRTFRRIRPNARLGQFTGNRKDAPKM